MSRFSDVLSLIFAAALLVALVGWWRSATRTRRHNRSRLRHAIAGEEAADALLRAEGYHVLDQQVSTSFLMHIDGDEVWVQNRCDRIVEREGLVFVADVKTGDRARDPTNPSTRRQLLEYLLAHEADGVLLIDMDAEVIVEVAFPGLLGEETREVGRI